MIRGLFSTELVTITADATPEEAAILMRDRRVDALIVLAPRSEKPSERKAIGVLSERSLMIQCLASSGAKPTRVSECMSGHLVYVNEEAGLLETVRAMKESSVDCLLVVNERQALVGYLNASTVLARLSEEPPELSLLAPAHESPASPRDEAPSSASGPRSRKRSVNPTHH